MGHGKRNGINDTDAERNKQYYYFTYYCIEKN